jgi:hypothetical protein
MIPNEPEQELTLAQIEEEVLAEGREWTRQRLEQKLQERLIGSAGLFPRGGDAWCVVKKES